MLGLGLQATLRPKAEGAARPVQDGLVLADNFRKSPVNDELGLTFPSNGSAVFNGTSDYIQLPDPFSLTNHTIAAWVYANDTANNKIIFDNRDLGGDGIVLYFDGTEYPSYLVNSASINTSTSYQNVWIYFVGTYDGTTQKLYIDGSQIASATTSQTISTTTNAIIGARSFSPLSSPFDGNLANVAIWNRALTSDEINSVMWKGYDSLTASEQNGLQAWYALDNITGTDVPDSTGNYNGTAY
jgi:large repetitive protein